MNYAVIDTLDPGANEGKEESPEDPNGGLIVKIDVPHLLAAMAAWRFSETSAAYIFGGLLGDPVADEILDALKRAATAGMTRWQISDMFNRNESKARIGAALALLVKSERAYSILVQPKGRTGRPTETWFAGRRPKPQ